MNSLNDEKESTVHRQLIIIGNGFDRQCGLKSTFADYFANRFGKASEAFEKMQFPILPGKGKNRNRMDPKNLWNLIFAYYASDNGREDQQDSWSNVEQIICDWVVKPGIIENILDSKGSRAFNVLAHSIETDSMNRGYTRWPRSGNVTSDPAAQQIFYNTLRNDLRGELGKLEQDFSAYLESELRGDLRSKYLAAAVSLFQRIAVSDTDVPVEGQKNTVLSFNYTEPLKWDGNDIGLDIWRSVHGTLDENNIIFGVDGTGLGTSTDDVVQYTKTFRVLTRQSENSVRFHQFRLLDNDKGPISVIKFYGHSLGEADYSYFKAIFDSLDLYNSNVRLVFYYPSDKPNIQVELFFSITRLLSRYGSDLMDSNRGQNLMHKMLLEDRIRIAELDFTLLVNAYSMRN